MGYQNRRVQSPRRRPVPDGQLAFAFDAAAATVPEWHALARAQLADNFCIGCRAVPSANCAED
jgi:hypothetical protein